ncbi:D-glycerate dehydrogenase [Salicibibacter cibi]|uniref:D-glycerate dehydrogenase n=1 Tax=Salicibibacter cibi TaxID=2743001 RepID=A0A7T6ZEJ4_9BACI|nr:D-glycerate dehydrogenase [Salicibibacter cibi]QQK81822.1 D-glycerate dehydrogenase [Salicibibacter cibi]
MKPKVFLAAPVPEEVESYIGQHFEFRKWDGEGPIPDDHLRSEISDVEGLLITGKKIDDSLLNQAPKLKIVSNASVGYNNFDIEAMQKHDVIGTNTPHVLDDTVSDLIFGLILSAARRLPELDHYVKQGRWKNGEGDRKFFGTDVHHATLGLIGMGRVGEKIAKRGKYGFDMNVLYYNRSRKYEVEKEHGYTYASLEDLLRHSDFVVLMTPLSSETVHFIGRDEFKLMKDSGVFVNGSRGQTVDEKAMVEALQAGEIRSVALDVFQQEPVDPEHPLLQMPNAVTIPHIGSATNKTRSDMAKLAAENLVKGVNGEEPPNIVKEFKD